MDCSFDTIRLGDVCTFTQGVQIADKDTLKEPAEGYIRYIYIRDLFSDRYPVYVKDEYPNKVLEPSDIVMVNTGNTSGHVYRAKRGVLCNNAFKIAIKSSDKSRLDNDFLWVYLNSDARERMLKRLFNSAGQPHVGHKNVACLNIPLPVLEEQKKIAKILSTWDKAIATVEKLIANSQQQKKSLMQQLLTGKKRLPGFEGEWKYLTFDEAFKVANKKSSQVKSSEYLDSGSIPIIDQSQRLIAGYCNSDDAYSDIPVIVFGDHTRCIKWVDFVFSPGADGTQVLKPMAALDKKFGYYVLVNTDIANLGYSRHMRELKEKDFKVPMDGEEQQKIATILTSADNEIESLQKQLEHLQQEKRALMQQLLTGKRRVLVN